MARHRPPRLKGFSYVGLVRYSLTFCACDRTSLFNGARLVDRALGELRRTANEEKFALLAYCFMPDHLHLVVEGQASSSDLRRFVKISKQRVAYVFRTTMGIAATWQEGYYERVLRSDEATDAVVRYVLDNPVRAGLARHAEEYRYSGALYWPEPT